MDFPRFVFTSPGSETCQGGTYGSELVADQSEYDAAIEAGFFGTLPEALAQAAKPAEDPEPSPVVFAAKRGKRRA